MAKQEIMILGDGTRVKYSFIQRHPNPYIEIRFRSQDGRRLHKSTGKTNINAAREQVASIITEEYRPAQASLQFVEWDAAIARLKDAWAAKNLRPATVSDYLKALSVLRRLFPGTLGPADVSDTLAKQFKIKRMSEVSPNCRRTVAPKTVASNLNKLSCIWTWFVEKLEIVGTNPWEDVEPPKVDKKVKRIITPEEETAFITWLESRYPGMRFPVLLFQVKACIGCRIAELCGLETRQLRDGRIWFAADETKGRKERGCLLPLAVFAELQSQAGSVYVWEKWQTELAAHYARVGGRYRRYIGNMKGFTPERLVAWIEDQVTAYCNENKGVEGFRPFTPHNFRGTAMSRAKAAGISDEDASIAFDCHMDTIKVHSVEFDEVRVADEVFSRIQSRYGGEQPQQ